MINSLIEAALYGLSLGSGSGSFFSLDGMSMGMGVTSGISSAYVKGSLKYTFMGSNKSIDAHLNLNDLFGTIWSNIKQGFWQFADLGSLAAQEFAKIGNVLGDAIKKAANYVLDTIVNVGSAVVKGVGYVVSGGAKLIGSAASAIFGRRLLSDRPHFSTYATVGDVQAMDVGPDSTYHNEANLDYHHLAFQHIHHHLYEEEAMLSLD